MFIFLHFITNKIYLFDSNEESFKNLFNLPVIEKKANWQIMLFKKMNKIFSRFSINRDLMKIRMSSACGP